MKDTLCIDMYELPIATLTSLLNKCLIDNELTFSFSIPKSEQVCSTNMSNSVNVLESMRSSIRSRAVSFPCLLIDLI